MTMSSYFQMLARYNRWANRRLYDAAALLSEEDLQADHGVFFGSMIRTLNHLLVTDRIWMRRLQGTGPEHQRLDEVVTMDFAALRPLREAEDSRIADYVAQIADSELGDDFSYRPVSQPDTVVTQPRGQALLHVFNHQTHHRGQASAILTRIKGRQDHPVLDLAAFQRDKGTGTA